MERPVAARFGNNLRRHRRRAGLTQAELARRAELSRVSIGMLERGEADPRLDTILRVCGGVECSPDVLLVGIHWFPGRYVEGAFRVDDGSEWAAGTASGV